MALTETQLTELTKKMVGLYQLIRDSLLDQRFSIWMKQQAAEDQHALREFDTEAKERLGWLGTPVYRLMIRDTYISDKPEFIEQRWKLFLAKYDGFAEFLSNNISQLNHWFVAWCIERIRLSSNPAADPILIKNVLPVTPPTSAALADAPRDGRGTVPLLSTPSSRPRTAGFCASESVPTAALAGAGDSAKAETAASSKNTMG